jgi:hypothetical protein
MEKGRRTQVSLGTSDYSDAVVKATEILQNPFLEVRPSPLKRNHRISRSQGAAKTNIRQPAGIKTICAF